MGIYLDTVNIFIRILMLLAGSGNRKRWEFCKWPSNVIVEQTSMEPALIIISVCITAAAYCCLIYPVFCIVCFAV